MLLAIVIAVLSAAVAVVSSASVVAVVAAVVVAVAAPSTKHCYLMSFVDVSKNPCDMHSTSRKHTARR